MGQPVVDTSRLSDALQNAGVEREQAEGTARALSAEFEDHVAVRGDLDAGFERVRSEVALVRSDLEARIDGVRSDLGGRIAALDSRFSVVGVGAGLILALLTLLVGIDLYDRTTPASAIVPPAALETLPLSAPAPSPNGGA